MGTAGIEDTWWQAHRHWSLLAYSVAINTLYSVAVALGVAIAGPFFVAFGNIAAIPVNMAADFAFRGTQPSAWEISEAVTITVSIILSQITTKTSEQCRSTHDSAVGS